MISKTLRKLEERIRAAGQAGDDTKDELLSLVQELRSEFAEIEASHEADAREIARHAGDVADADEPSGVEEALLEFESSHPRMVGLFRSLMRTLADAGI